MVARKRLGVFENTGLDGFMFGKFHVRGANLSTAAILSRCSGLTDDSSA